MIETVNNVEEKIEHKLNRAQRRKMEQEQARKDKHIRKKADIVKSESSKINSLIAGMKEKAISIKEETGFDKMYFCINSKNIEDTLIINYIGSEELKNSLGIKTDLTLDNGNVRKDNLVVYVEVLEDNKVNIDDGRGLYLNKDA